LVHLLILNGAVAGYSLSAR